MPTLAGSTLFFITVEAGCPINPSVNGDWLSLTKFDSGFFMEWAANTTSQMREATINVGDASTRIFQVGSNQASLHNAHIAHFAVGGGWETTLQFVNASDSIARAGLAPTLGISGSISGISAYVDDEMFYTSTYLYGLNRILQPHAIVGIYSAEPGSVATSVGCFNLQFDPGVGGFARFRYVPTGQEAMVPIETRMAKSFTLGFDNTNGIATGIAVGCGELRYSAFGRSCSHGNYSRRRWEFDRFGNQQYQCGDARFLCAQRPVSEHSGQKRNHPIQSAAAAQISVIGRAFPAFEPL